MCWNVICIWGDASVHSVVSRGSSGQYIAFLLRGTQKSPDARAPEVNKVFYK